MVGTQESVSRSESKAVRVPASRPVATPKAPKAPVPSLRELIASDPDIKTFLKFAYEEDMREEALRFLNRAITKKRPIPSGAN